VAGFFSESDDVRRLVTDGLVWIPLLTAASAPFFPLRSAFEGMGRPRPGLVVSAVRMALLVVPFSFAGMHLAPELGEPPLVGVYAGSTLGTVVATVWLALWMRRALRDPGSSALAG
jgi:Na+-driven multidrug efflux pump